MKPCGISDCFRHLLACPVLRRVTVQVGRHVKENDEWRNAPERVVCNLDEIAVLDFILPAATEMYQGPKKKIGQGLNFETRHLRIGEHIKAWEERMGNAGVEGIGAAMLEGGGPAKDARSERIAMTFCHDYESNLVT